MPKKSIENKKLRKVTPENYQLMKSLLANGVTQADLRRAFNLSSATTSTINRFDTYDEYRNYILEQSYRAKARAEARAAAAEASVEESVEEPTEEPAEEPVEKPVEEAHPVFKPDYTEANQERIIELLEQILKKLDCAEMVVSDEAVSDAPKRRGLFSFGSKAPF